MSRSLGLAISGAWVTVLVTYAAVCSAAPPNQSQTPTAETKSDPVAAVEVAPKKRPVQDYGRPKEPMTAKEGLLWIPRILLAPLYLATEYLVRRPLGAVISALEHNKLVQRVFDVSTKGPQRDAGISPSFYLDYGRMPAAGVYLWWDHVGSPKNHLRGYFATWGEPLIAGTIADRYELTPTTAASMRVAYTHRTDNLFFGVGPNTTSRTESRFESTTLEGGPTFEHRFFRAQAGIRDVRYADGTCCSSPGLFELVRSGRLPPPPRLLDAGYTSVFQAASFAVDTRRERRASGARVAVTGAPSFDISEHPGQSWVRYQASVLGAWDMTGTSRTLSLSAHTLFVDPMQGGNRGIPFTELVTLGGDGPMRGYLPGRLTGRSAAVAALNYEWPIWTYVDGTIETAVGNVFDAGLKGFSTEKLRLSTAIGLRSNSSRDHVFEFLSGFGTETFEQGARITSFRLAIGASRAF